ncbi:right-handed parallel beta-helix repeat-containing protein [Pantoea sp. At-9b]|uniref:right-handed parallel beta-helix repeat-containing protein n=1 Tax=Pantoea sp. (strain At-9b) TaxID=592316 RepID=UPI0001B3F7D7|nr:right-handed parallel beta-helix repeat-containing protein [Pantoea sp. At-9b]ADU72291.1 hypothetical protein Pat9b_4995 [Pantoea sp. At-9b]
MHRRSFIAVILSSIALHENCFAKPSISPDLTELKFDKDVLIHKSGNKVDREYLINNDSFDSDFLFVKNKNDGIADLYVYHEEPKNLGFHSRDYVYTRRGGVWARLNYYFTLEDFGAISDGVTDCSREISLALNSGLVIRSIDKGVYLLRDTVRISAVSLDFMGFGKGRTVFLLDHINHGVVYDEPRNKNDKCSVNLSGFTIKRLNSNDYKSAAGPKGLYVANASPLRIYDVEECYGIGYGVHIDFSNDIIIKRCHVHNHQDDMGGASGTDGIHIYRSENILVENNVIHDVGDDAISTGSFDPKYRIKNVVIKDNYIYNTKSGIKIYSFASDVNINNNRIVNSREGGVYITDDKNSIDDATVDNIVIMGNFFSAIGLSSKSDEAGALRIRFWPNKNTKSLISNITFKNNKIQDCLTGVSILTYDYAKKAKNIYIINNVFKETVNGENFNIRYKQLQYFIRVVQCYGDFIVSKNNFHTEKPTLIKFDIAKTKDAEGKFIAIFMFIDNRVHVLLKTKK